jgi:hypothetical protein
MTPRAFTPLFRWWERRFPRAAQPDIQEFPAPSSGNHAGEAAFLALATGLLTACWAIPATSSLTSLPLRVPAVALLLFVVPQLLMAAVSLVSPWLAGPRFPREAAQDWCCLALMTAYAALRSTEPGWESMICQGWLAFVALNLLLWPWSKS